MGLTRSQRMRHLARFAEQGMVDRTATLWTDEATGMRVARIETVGDHWLEGRCMGNCLQLHEYEDPARWPERLNTSHWGNTYYTLRDGDGYPRATFRLHHLWDDATQTRDDVWTPWEIRAKANGAVDHDLLDVIDRAAVDLGWRKVPQSEYEYVPPSQMAA